MERYNIIFYNRFACETQSFRVMAEDVEHAERLFWIEHDKESYKDCIEGIETEKALTYYTEEELLERERKRENKDWNHNHGRFSKTFKRVTCPICGAPISKHDARDGSFDAEVFCTIDKGHYRNFFSLFGDSITILDKRFDGEKDIEKINDYLDGIGNPEYRERIR